MKIDGKEIAQNLFQDLQKRVETLQKKSIVPHVAIIVVGDDPASIAYVGQKQKKAESIGAKATIYHLPEPTTQEELVLLLEKLNTDPLVHGIIVQRPLPKHIDNPTINLATIPIKDIDAFRKNSPYDMPLASAVLKILEEVYKLETRNSKRKDSGVVAFTPPQNDVILVSRNEVKMHPESVSDLEIRNSDFLFWLQSKKVVVIGKGETGGGPIIQTLQTMGVTPAVIDSKTQNPQEITKNADILITTVGKEGVITKEDVKQGAILLGVGMYRGSDGKLHADYNDDDIAPHVSFYTSVPGGVGPVNVAMLLKNLLQAANATHS